MKFFPKIIILFLVVLIVLAGILFFTKTQNKISQVCFAQNCYVVELATTNAQREQGLMFRNNLDKNKGMLFIFDTPGVYPFWMKNTLIPLDMIWIDGNKKVVFVGENIQPCLSAQAGKITDCSVINPQISANYVLEINAGQAQKIKLKTGDFASFGN